MNNEIYKTITLFTLNYRMEKNDEIEWVERMKNEKSIFNSMLNTLCIILSALFCQKFIREQISFVNKQENNDSIMQIINIA